VPNHPRAVVTTNTSEPPGARARAVPDPVHESLDFTCSDAWVGSNGDPWEGAKRHIADERNGSRDKAPAFPHERRAAGAWRSRIMAPAIA
jgi:hypothetical protein